MSSSKNTLVYDADCGFCQASVNWLKSILGERINIIPRLELADGDYGISHEDSNKAIQLIELDSDGHQVYRAAEAVLKVLSYQGAWAFWYWLYKYIPGFAWLAEWVYEIVADNRSGDCKL